MISLFASIVAGLLAVLAFPPFGWGFLTVPAVVVFLWSLRRAASSLIATLAAAAFGITFFGLLMWWITRTEAIALLALVISQSVFVAAFGWFVYRQRDLPLTAWVIVISGGWGLMELLRGWAPVGGLQWGGLGYALAPYASARGAASWIGVSGWTVVIVMTAAVVVRLMEDRMELRWAGSLAAVWAVLLSVGSLWPAVADGAELTVTVVQGNTPCVEHCAGDRQAIYENHLRLTQALPPSSADLVVWGESATGFSTDPLLNPAVARDIEVEASRIGSYFLVGGDRPVDDEHFVNANMVFDRDGRYLGEYNKRHPVPFGEYVPWRPVFGLIPATNRVPRDMVRGSGPVVFELDSGSIGSVISFEGAFARYTRDHVAAGAKLMIVATNERSYGVGPAADQLIDMTRMHAAENGIDLVQAAITGKSALIVDGGRVDLATGLYEEATITGTVRFRESGRTMTGLLGDWVAAISIVGLVGCLTVLRLRNPRKNRRAT